MLAVGDVVRLFHLLLDVLSTERAVCEPTAGDRGASVTSRYAGFMRIIPLLTPDRQLVPPPAPIRGSC